MHSSLWYRIFKRKLISYSFTSFIFLKLLFHSILCFSENVSCFSRKCRLFVFVIPTPHHPWTCIWLFVVYWQNKREESCHFVLCCTLVEYTFERLTTTIKLKKIGGASGPYFLIYWNEKVDHYYIVECRIYK